jgi:hypothetical protein
MFEQGILMKLEEISATTHKSNIGAHHEPVKFK